MGGIKLWLRSANGYQRLWLVLSTILFLWLAIAWPFIENSNGSLSRYEYRWAVERNFANPDCLPYQTKPLSELAEPEYVSEGRQGCWHMYTHRVFNNHGPLTLDQYHRNFFWAQWENIGTLAGMGAIGAIVLSLIAYWLGKVAAWVIRGFRQKPAD